MRDTPDARHPPSGAVLVCGLGQLGQACALALRGYLVPVLGIDLQPRESATLGLARLTRGDLRDPEVLRAAGAPACRAILFVTSDAQTNMQGALAARHLSPSARIVVRAAQQPRYATLNQHLGDFVAYVPHHLAAASFALAALDSEVVAHFYVRDRLFQVVAHRAAAADPKLGRALSSLESPETRVLLHVPARSAEPAAALELQRWWPEATVQEGDLLYLLSAREPSVGSPMAAPSARAASLSATGRGLRRAVAGALRPCTQEGRLGLAGLVFLAGLLALSVACLLSSGPVTDLRVALRISLLLLLSNGHLADVFESHEQLSPTLHWAEIMLTLGGTVLTAVLYAVLTNRLLAARFQLLARRPKPPAHDHVVIAGLGSTGVETARFLRQLGRPAVAIEKSPIEAHVLPELAVVRADASEPQGLAEAHVATALGVVAATGDDLVSIEVALAARSLNPHCGMVVRLRDARLAESVAALVPGVQALCTASLAAAAFAAAALGEHVSNVFHLRSTPVLVTEYLVDDTDTLHGHELWEIAEGYGVVPMLLQRAEVSTPIWSLDDAHIRLRAGDRLVVLATTKSLESIERGALRPRPYELRLERTLPFAEPVQIVGVLSRSLGWTLAEAHALLRAAPITLPKRLYPIHALRTMRLLQTRGVQVRLGGVETGPDAG